MQIAVQVNDLEPHYSHKVAKPDGQGHQESFAMQCENISDVEEPRSSRFLPRKLMKKTGTSTRTFLKKLKILLDYLMPKTSKTYRNYAIWD